MRHRKQKTLLNRFTSWRQATLVSLVRSVLVYQRIRTTVRKAHSVQPLLERLITLAKENTLSAKRKANQILNDHGLVQILFGEIGERFKSRQSGFSRIIRIGPRRGDNAELAFLELTELKKETKKAKKAKEAKPQEEKKALAPEEKPAEEKKAKAEEKVLEKPPITQKPSKNFLGGLRKIFKKERDSL